MSKTENIQAFESTIKQIKALQEKDDAATLTQAEMERAIAKAQELRDEDLAQVAGAGDSSDTVCMVDYNTNGKDWNSRLTNNTTNKKFG